MPGRSSVALFALVLFVAPAISLGQCSYINSASIQPLRQIIYIDEERAPEIVRLRQERPFTSVDQPIRVHGIGQARVRDIQNQGAAYVR